MFKNMAPVGVLLVAAAISSQACTDRMTLIRSTAGPVAEYADVHPNGEPVFEDPALHFATSFADLPAGARIPGAIAEDIGKSLDNGVAATEISFVLSEPTDVTLSLFNSQGQFVRRLVDRPMPAGQHAVRFSAGGLASGVYYYRLDAGSSSQMRKMMVLG